METSPDATPGRSAAATARFEAATYVGLLRLSIRRPVRHAADAAIALADCDPLLAALDAWCGAPLDWRWTASSPERRSAAEAASACWVPAGGGAAPPAVVLEIDWTLLRNLPAPPAELAETLRWAHIPAVLAISQRLGADELTLLEPGGAVLLPDSQSAPWRGLLRAAIEPAYPGAGVPVELRWPQGVRGIPPERHGPAPASTASTHEVQMPMAGVLSCDRLAGWVDGDIGPVGPAAALWSCAALGMPAHCLAQGELMPWGDGWALAIRTTNP
jgi:hypothetical protein